MLAYYPAIPHCIILLERKYKESMFLEEGGERRRYTLFIVKEIKEQKVQLEVGPLHTLFVG